MEASKSKESAESRVNERISAFHQVKRGSAAVGKGLFSVTIGAIASVDLTKAFTDLTRDSNGMPTHYMNGNDPVTAAVFFGGLVGFSIVTERLLQRAINWARKKSSE